MILAAVPPSQIECRFEPGLSDESRDIWAQMEEIRLKGRNPITFSWRESLQDEIVGLMQAYSKSGWDGYDAEPISLDSANNALLVLNNLPDHLTPPRVIPEPDGEIALEWHSDRGINFSLSISGTALTYAGVIGGSSKKYGAEPYFGVLPPAILRILAEYFSQA